MTKLANTNWANTVWRPCEHLTELDGIRGLAILTVTIYRFGRDLPTDSWNGQILASIFQVGSRGVELFFVLSGFLITNILIQAKGSAGYFKNFYARRSVRIFPLYFAALFLFLWVIPWAMPSSHPFGDAESRQFYLWTYQSNLWMSYEDRWCFGGLDHFWSLAVEEHFYLIWPFVIGLLCLRTSLVLAVAVTVVASGTRILWSALAISNVAPDVHTLMRCDGLLIGAILAMLAHASSLVSFRIWAIRALPVLILMGVGLDMTGRRILTIGSTVWPLAWFALLLILLTSSRDSRLARVFDGYWLRNLGKYSYGMYVFQSPLIPLAAPLLAYLSLSDALGPLLSHLITLMILFAATYGLAWISWHCFEKHCLKLKKWFPDGLPKSKKLGGVSDDSVGKELITGTCAHPSR